MSNVPQVEEATIFFILKMLNEPIDHLTQLQKRYGDIYKKKIRGIENYFLSHPKYAEHLLSSHQANYQTHPLIFERFEVFLGANNLLMTNDMPQWYRDRELTKAAFEITTFFEKYSNIITEKCNVMLNSWLQMKDKSSVISVIELDKLIVNIVKNTLFHNIEVDAGWVVERLEEAFEIIRKKSSTLMPFLWSLPTKRRRQYQQVVNSTRELWRNILLTRCKSGKDYDDILGILLHAYQVHDEHSPDFNSVGNHFITFQVAGNATTASTIQWIYTLLSQYPEVENKITEEVANVCNGRTPLYSDYTNLKYTQATISEVLRLYPPIPFLLRQAIAEDTIEDFTIPAKSCFLINSYNIHRHVDYWNNPEKFDPNRFLEKKWGQDFQHAYLPFGAGKRGCLGRNFAMLEICLIVAMISQRFKLLLPKDLKVKRTYAASLFLRPNVRHFILQPK